MIRNFKPFLLVIFLTTLLDIVNSWCLKTQMADTDKINSIDWSQDGTKIVTASTSGRVVVWDARTFEQLFVYNFTSGGSTVAVFTAKFSRNNSMIAIGGNQQNIHVIRVGGTYSTITTSVNAGFSPVYEVDFNDATSALIACGFSQTGIFWQINNANPPTFSIRNPTATIANSGQAVWTCKNSPSNNQAAFGSSNGNGYSFTYNINNNFNNQKTLANTSASIRRCLDWNQISGQVNFVGSDMNLEMWNVNGNSASRKVAIGKDMYTVSIAKDGTYAAMGGAAGAVEIWNIINATEFREESLNESTGSSVRASALSPDSEFLLIGNDNGQLYLYKRICNGCPSGTYVNGTQCRACNKDMRGCYLCINSTHCKACSNGFWLDTSSTATHLCKPCYTSMTGCSQCSANNNCSSCVQGYYLTTASPPVCAPCWDVMKGCLMCNASNSCLQCDYRYYLNSSNSVKCVSCTNITNCLSCNSSSYCLDCVQGYYESGTGTCTQCTKNCTNCINGSYCTQCDNSFYLSGGVCAPCTVKGCLSCNSTNYCFDCLESMWENAGSCSFCTPPCLQCTTSATTCKSCIVGYYISGTSCNSCTGLLTGCVGCKGSNAATDCTACATGYYLNGATCSLCTGVKANCAECNATACHICKLGFWYDSTVPECKLCSAGCLTCTNSTDCLTCQVGFYHTSPANTCTQCPLECSACESGTVCRSCNPRYYYNSTNNNCTKCSVTNCITCKDATTCITCIEGFFPDSSGTVCRSCAPTIPKCLDCHNSTYCKACELGFYLISTNASCSECVSPCSTCDKDGCFTCELGYFLNTNTPKSCTPCAKECEQCVGSASNCSRCVPGYYLDSTNNVCLLCSNIKTGCMSCNSSTCFECNLALGYFHNSSDNSCPLCSSKITNCLNCLSDTNCILCKYGYIATATNTTCTLCSSQVSNCEHCVSTTSCQTCLKGFYVDGSGNCKNCMDGCSSCNASGICEICLREYVLETNFSCTLCQQKLIGCQMCKYNPTIQCTNCITGYYLTSTTCTLCSTTLEGCSICNDASTCLTCTSGYYHSPTNKCFLCSSNRPNCQLCQYNTATSSVDCINCNEGYFLNSTFQCQTCTDLGCISCSDSTTCTRCQTGFFLSNGDCLKCQDQYQGCIMCNTTNCLQCGSGFYLGGSSTCQPCSLQGCEICSQLNPTTKCLGCNSQYYLTSSQTCELCKVPLPNCLQCVNSLTCQQCESGYFISPLNKCSLCSSKFTGCTLCTPSVCMQCESGYLLDPSTSTCQLCSTYMPGCSFCLSSSSCLSCQGGFYANGNTCKRCNTITGCLECASATQCIFCDYGYYLLNDTCYPCNTTIDNCVACASSVMCTACLGNYVLSAGACAQLKAESYPNYTDIKLITEYVSETQLKHTLQSVGKKLTQTDLDWSKESKIYLMDDNYTEHALTIKRFEFSPQGYSLVFYTDNPMAGMANTDSMPLIGRLLGGFNLNTKMKTKIQMTQVGVNSLFPSVHHSGTFFMKYKLSQPQFYRSVVNTKTYYYEYFGFIISIILVILYFVKSMILAPGAIDKGEIIPHILCFKMMAFVVYPLYGEYLNYCKGFVLLDFPWFDHMLSAMLTVDTDVAPEQYKIFYNNLNLPSTYLFAFAVITVILLLGYFVINCLLRNPEQWNNFRGYIYNLFISGAVIGSFLALQGAYFNPVQSISVNSLFYILAISIFVIIVLESIYSLYKSTPETGIPFHKIRIILKCMGLSLAYANPLYIFMSLVFLDLCLLVIQYMLKRENKVSPKLWLFNNILVDASLSMMMLGPYSLISVFVASGCILVVLGIDIYIMIKEHEELKMIDKVKVQENELIKTMEAIEKERSSARAKNHQIHFKNRILEQFEQEKNQPVENKTTNESQASLMNKSHESFSSKSNSHLFFEQNENQQPRNDFGAIPITEQEQQHHEQSHEIRLPEVAQSKKRAANKTSMLKTWSKKEKRDWNIEEDKKDGTFVLGDFD